MVCEDKAELLLACDVFCTTEAISFILLFILFISVSCSCEFLVHDSIISEIVFIFVTISVSDDAVLCAIPEPSDIFAIELSIKAVVSLAACWLLAARLRTSSATTANPFPCSPARAASTAALSASMFVWKAISSITFIIFDMLFDASFISLIAESMLPICSFPADALSFVIIASSFASFVFLRFCEECFISSDKDLSNSSIVRV